MSRDRRRSRRNVSIPALSGTPHLPNLRLLRSRSRDKPRSYRNVLNKLSSAAQPHRAYSKNKNKIRGVACPSQLTRASLLRHHDSPCH